MAPGRGLPLAVDKERGGRKRRARSPPLSAKSWGYSAFQYIMAPAGPQKKRCAAASQGPNFELPRPFGPRQGGAKARVVGVGGCFLPCQQTVRARARQPVPCLSTLVVQTVALVYKRVVNKRVVNKREHNRACTQGLCPEVFDRSNFCRYLTSSSGSS